jgi:hypothetical protein
VLIPWLSAFLFTQCVEVPIYAKLAKSGLLPAFGASALTHPIVWFVIPPLWRSALPPPWDASYWGMVAAAETFAVVVEAIYLGYGFRVKRALAWALLANVSSCGLGFLSRWMFGWP